MCAIWILTTNFSKHLAKTVLPCKHEMEGRADTAKLKQDQARLVPQIITSTFLSQLALLEMTLASIDFKLQQGEHFSEEIVSLPQVSHVPCVHH